MITIYSSFAKDKIFDEKGRLVFLDERGGPAFYIEKIFKKSGLPYVLITGKPIEVEIRLIKNKEVGRVKKKIKTKKISSKNEADPILISTIGREWILDNNVPENTKIFLDIQGYVRNLEYFGRKTFFKDSFLKNIFCLKGTGEEMNYLPKNVIQKQKRKCLIITRGGDGLIFYYKGKKLSLKPREKLRCKNTIGAGDTLFANFVVQFLKTDNAPGSIKYAVDKTSEFLYSKDN